MMQDQLFNRLLHGIYDELDTDSVLSLNPHLVALFYPQLDDTSTTYRHSFGAKNDREYKHTDDPQIQSFTPEAIKAEFGITFEQYVDAKQLALKTYVEKMRKRANALRGKQ